MKQYIVTHFDGWYDHTWVIPESKLKDYNDGSFTDGKEYRVFEVSKEISIEEMFKSLGDFPELKDELR